MSEVNEQIKTVELKGVPNFSLAKKMPLDSFLKYEIDGESIGQMAMMQRNKNNLPLSFEP